MERTFVYPVPYHRLYHADAVPNEDETAVYGCHRLVNMVVCMRKVLLYGRVGACVSVLKLVLFNIIGVTYSDGKDIINCHNRRLP